MKTKTQTIYLGDATISLESDVYEAEILDTWVSIEGASICTIAGCDIPAFIKELAALVDKYSI